ncbi:hypothetical protein [Arcobacter porcinus]|uniref:Uncharacterized protein n=1 Tax=Arcobacter porcinus TaxID=1935204 RepID=A0A5C2HL48_9BACT|nr:hypothetical protein [Arcobacter porcinus]OCL94285.1 hypothetical protein AAX27_01081 [Aliarcobacter thereius]QEP40988.1 hypothetical protein APORC_1403 [Arcobacter porcinus]
MSFFALINDILIIELEVKDKINDKFLKEFISTNLNLNNITLEKNQKIYINYLEITKEYQIFILDKKFKHFEYEAILKEFKEFDFLDYSLFIYDDFFVIFKNKEFFYFNKLNKNVNKSDLLSFLKKKFNIEFSSIKELSKDELEILKNSYESKYKNHKKDKNSLKNINLSKDYSFILYIVYVFLVVVFITIYFKNEIDMKNSTKNLDAKIISKELEFRSFTNELNKIIENIENNDLNIVILDFKYDQMKMILESKSKENFNKFLNNFNKIEQSSIDFISDRETFRLTIDVELFK